MSVITAIVAFTPSRGRCNWCANSTTAPTPTVPVTPTKPRTRDHDRSAQVGDRVGRPLLDRSGALRWFHWSISQIQSDLWDDYRIKLSADSITRYIGHYQVMLAAREQDPDALRQHYQGVDEIILSIDGLQPERGTRPCTWCGN